MNWVGSSARKVAEGCLRKPSNGRNENKEAWVCTDPDGVLGGVDVDRVVRGGKKEHSERAVPPRSYIMIHE